jgi:hypothetical protein
MPLPRNPRPKRLVRGSRSGRRRAHKQAWLTFKIAVRFEAIQAQLERRNQYTYRGAYGVISYFKPGETIPPGYQKVEFDENGKMIADTAQEDTAQEKAPGLAAEGFSTFFNEKEKLSG